MARWNEVKKESLSDYNEYQAEQKGKIFHKAWLAFQALEKEKADKQVRKFFRQAEREAENELKLENN